MCQKGADVFFIFMFFTTVFELQFQWDLFKVFEKKIALSARMLSCSIFFVPIEIESIEALSDYIRIQIYMLYQFVSQQRI